MPANCRPYVVYDLETSGRSYRNGAEIVQIAAVTINHWNFEINKDIGPFNIVLKPENPEKADSKAIEVIGEDLWEKAQTEGIHQKVGLRKFKEYLDKSNSSGKFWSSPILVGFNNARFDDPLLTHYMLHYGIVKSEDSFPWAYLGYDMITILHSIFGKDSMPNHKLDTFLEMFGLYRSSDEHDALEDVELTAQLFIKYMKFIESIRGKIKIQKVNKEEMVTNGC